MKIEAGKAEGMTEMEEGFTFLSPVSKELFVTQGADSHRGTGNSNSTQWACYFTAVVICG